MFGGRCVAGPAGWQPPGVALALPPGRRWVRCGAAFLADDWCLAEEKVSYLAPFLPVSTDLPSYSGRLRHREPLVHHGARAHRRARGRVLASGRPGPCGCRSGSRSRRRRAAGTGRARRLRWPRQVRPEGRSQTQTDPLLADRWWIKRQGCAAKNTVLVLYGRQLSWLKFF